jgi:hypothetical protein
VKEVWQFACLGVLRSSREKADWNRRFLASLRHKHYLSKFSLRYAPRAETLTGFVRPVALASKR